MEWLEECTVDLKTSSGDEDQCFKIQQIENIEKINQSFSVLTEFFISIASKVSNTPLISIFLANAHINTILLEDVVTHFKERKVIMINNIPTELMLRHPKSNSVNYIMNSPKNPVIQSLYDINKPVEDSDEWTPRKTFKVISEKIEQYENQDFDKILPYLKPAKGDSYLFLSLFDWYLSDSLKNSLAIRYFSHKFKEIYLWVDQNEKVTEIQLLV